VIAVTNISWSPSVDKLVIPNSLKFRGIRGLHQYSYLLRKPLVSNNPSSEEWSVGIPEGHPPIVTFLSMPVFYGRDCIGTIGFANRLSGYNDDMLPVLERFCQGLGSFMMMYSQLSSQTPQIENSLSLTSQELAASVMSSISDGVIVTNGDLRVLFMNAGAQSMLGMTQIPSSSILQNRIQKFFANPTRLEQAIDWKQFDDNEVCSHLFFPPFSPIPLFSLFIFLLFCSFCRK
jgi:PAS domain-containing protein